MNDIQQNLKNVRGKIEKACVRNKEIIRDVNEVKLIAVSKKQPIDRVQAMLDCGQRLFGENRVQDAVKTWGSLERDFGGNLKAQYNDLELHLIGPLQTNKVQDAVQLFDVIQTVDRPKLVYALADEMKKQNKNLSCFIQVNTGEEEQKSGILPQELTEFLKLCREVELKIIGLMCIPPVAEPSALHFAFLKKLADEHGLKELSMGMSDDFDKAIPLGASYIRVGTALFGRREVLKT